MGEIQSGPGRETQVGRERGSGKEKSDIKKKAKAESEPLGNLAKLRRVEMQGRAFSWSLWSPQFPAAGYRTVYVPLPINYINYPSSRYLRYLIRSLDT